MTNKVVTITNITDLNMECLLTVFHYLEVTDLANLSEANITSKWKLGKRKRKSEINRFKQSIVKAFKIKVRANEWKISVHTDARYASKDIKMLRSFGKEIEALLIDYLDFYKNRRYEQAVEDAVTNNFSEKLTSIHFRICNADSMNELEKPFTNVKLVEFYDGHVGSTLGQLKKWFPKMKDLRLTDSYVFDSKCIHEHFPQLISLMVWNGRWQESKEGKMIFTNADLKVFFNLNPQLEMLNIRHDDVDESVSGDNAIIVDWDLLTFISKNLKLETLKLNLEYFLFGREWQSTVTIESLIKLDVECIDFDCLEKIKITSSNLNELNLTINLNYEEEEEEEEDEPDEQFNYNAIATFVIRTDPECLKIKVESNKFAVDNVQVLRMIRMLPKLEELIIDCLWNDAIPAGVMNLLVNSNALKKLVGIFNFDLDDEDEPCPKYLQMRQIFREKIDRTNVVARKWSYKFDYKDDDCYWVDTIQFQKEE